MIAAERRELGPKSSHKPWYIYPRGLETRWSGPSMSISLQKIECSDRSLRRRIDAFMRPVSRDLKNLKHSWLSWILLVGRHHNWNCSRQASASKELSRDKKLRVVAVVESKILRCRVPCFLRIWKIFHPRSWPEFIKAKDGKKCSQCRGLNHLSSGVMRLLSLFVLLSSDF